MNAFYRASLSTISLTYWLLNHLALRTDVAYLHYPVHILTGCAVILGAIESLVITMKGEESDKMRSLANGTAPRTKRREAACNCAKLQKKARKAMKNVELDMRELLNVSEVSTRRAFDACWSLMSDTGHSGTLDEMHDLA